MNKKSNKTTYAFFGIALLSIVILAGGWYYIQSQVTEIKIVTDSSTYFTIDKPIVELKLINPKSANSGEIALKFKEDVIKVANSEFAKGVTLRKLDNKYIFELSDIYFSSNNETVATLNFENVNFGTVDFEIDEELTSLKNGEVEVEFKHENVSVGVGVAPERGQSKEVKDTGTFDSF